ncbi:MAG: isoleucine--tRNA ligase [Gemmatimonadales bacterium]|nr:isoleucine--tRNA ligase [Gemmatimonadales bacterium]
MSAPRYPGIPVDERADALERELLHRWKAEDLFHETQRRTAGGKPFVFYEGPPTANGRPGIHHVFARTIKDLICRYHAMQGRCVTRIAGWDTHGLPVEIEVEKQLGISSKTEIGDHPGATISVTEFNRRCRESVWKYKADWESLSDRIGYWLDYAKPYITYTNDYVESVWWLLSQLHEKGLLIRGHKVLPYCPRCGTVLSSHELALGYDTAKDPSVYVLFPLEGEKGETGETGERYLLVWTTAPWTLVSNFAVAVHPELDYVEIEWKGRRVILAESRAAHLIPGGDTEPLSVRLSAGPSVRRFKGQDLVGLRYRRPLDVAPWPEGRRWEVIAGDFVTADDGSGLVHLAPFGADDFTVARTHDFAYAVPVDGAGKFRGTTWPEIEGVFVKDADAAIIQRLKADGLLLKRETIEHTYPFCWRCDTPLLYYPRESWFVRTTAVKDRLVAINRGISWHPAEIGTGRFGEWLENNVDWALSRDRFWGTPLPAWICDRDAAHVEVIGSYAKLAERWGRTLAADFDPHKPHIDGYAWGCRQCGGTMRRASEVIDTWFDSGAMPVAQWHYPFEHEREFHDHFPADFIAEGVDQTRGWFYSLLAIATTVFDRTAYRNVIVNELILDSSGQKMSKSRGNVVDPVAAVEKYGADAVRLYLLLSSQVWLPKKFDEKSIPDVAGNVLEKLRHIYHLFQLYAEDWAPSSADPKPADRPLADRWLLGRLARTVREVRAAWDGYDVTVGTRAIVAFVVDDLSNWWVRQSRVRFWVPGGTADPAALATLHEVLCVTARLLAPAAPFLSDLIHRALAGASVHLAPFPEAPEVIEGEALDRAMDVVRRLASLARGAREQVSLRVRQPLARLLAAIPADVDRGLFESLVPLLVAEVNVKRVELVGQGTDLVSLEARPSFRALGKRFGKATPEAAEAVRKLAPEEVVRFDAGEPVEIVVQGARHALQPDDVIVHRHARGDVVVETDGEVVAAIDPTLTDDLRQEGLAREVVSRVQRLRRDAGYKVTDRIELWVDGDETVRSTARRHAEYIAGETLARSVAVEAAPPAADLVQDMDVDGFKARLGVKRAN